ncbi:DUF4129 domain-containing protein [Gorillibacterium timonense]|uniref:DUF4129 domain-containing protein n=1 Tax=Gorillibacterium timonense TaxID=1689269 RepID=UPI00071D9561|nr:DUF4129 domain-containing protein [Gorillibacterium timonense]
MNNLDDRTEYSAGRQPEAKRQAMPPFVYLLLEGSVLTSGLLLFSGLAVKPVERWAMLLFLPIALVTGMLMLRMYRRFGLKAAFGTGAGIMAALSYGVLAGIADTSFLIWEAVLGFVLIGRFGLWLDDSISPEERFRGYFLIECIAVPVLVIIGFRQAPDASLVIAAVVIYLVLRGFSMVYAQRMASGGWSFRMRGALVLIGIVAIVLPLLFVFPRLLLVLAYLGTPVLRLLVWLGGMIRLRPMHRKETEVEIGEVNPDDYPWETSGAHFQIPSTVWIGIFILIALAVLVLFVKNRTVRGSAPTKVPVQIKRSRAIDTASVKLRYSSEGKGIRPIYRTLLRGMEDRGLPVREQETPREYSRRLKQELSLQGESGDQFDSLVEQYEEVRYGAILDEDDESKQGVRLPLTQAKQFVERMLAAFTGKPAEQGKERKQ